MTDYDPVRLGRLEDEAREVRAMAIGFGVASAPCGSFLPP